MAYNPRYAAKGMDSSDAVSAININLKHTVDLQERKTKEKKRKVYVVRRNDGSPGQRGSPGLRSGGNLAGAQK